MKFLQRSSLLVAVLTTFSLTTANAMWEDPCKNFLKLLAKHPNQEFFGPLVNQLRRGMPHESERMPFGTASSWQIEVTLLGELEVRFNVAEGDDPVGVRRFIADAAKGTVDGGIKQETLPDGTITIRASHISDADLEPVSPVTESIQAPPTQPTAIRDGRRIFLQRLAERFSPTVTTAQPEPTASVPAPFLGEVLNASNNRIATSLFSAVNNRANRDETTVLSPFSVSAAWLMAGLGARDETRREMLSTALGLDPALSNERLAESYTAFSSQVASNAFVISNSIWVNNRRGENGVTIEPEYEATLRTSFRARVTALDFAATTTLPRINDAVKLETNNEIPRLINSLNPRKDQTVLINAVVLKSRWKTLFDKSLTRQRLFRNSDGSTTEVPLMSREGQILYYQDTNYSGVRLPLSEDNVAVELYLPRIENGSTGLGIPPLADFQSKKLTLNLPRLNLNYQVDLVQAFRDLHITAPFDAADFSGMIRGERSVISRIIHAAHLSLDEEGVVAAAGTAVINSRAVSIAPTTTITFNRPFQWLIRDLNTRAILFQGRVRKMFGTGSP